MSRATLEAAMREMQIRYNSALNDFMREMSTALRREQDNNIKLAMAVAKVAQTRASAEASTEEDTELRNLRTLATQAVKLYHASKSIGHGPEAREDLERVMADLGAMLDVTPPGVKDAAG